jgi:hypothetical protein
MFCLHLSDGIVGDIDYPHKAGVHGEGQVTLVGVQGKLTETTQ